MSEERVWLRHAEHGGAFHCPAGAVEDWAEMGWAPGDAPEEFNPVVAERIAFERAQQEAAEQQAAEEKKTTKSSRKSGTDTTPQE